VYGLIRLAVFGGILTFAGTPAGAPTLELRHRFGEGQTHSYHLTASGQGRTLLQGLPGEPSLELPASFTLQGEVTWKVEKTWPPGGADLRLCLEALEVHGEVAGQGLNWTLPAEAQGPSTPPTFFLKVKPNGEVIEEKEESAAALQGLPAVLRNLPLFLRHIALRPLPLPARPVKPGETWEQVHPLELPYLASDPPSLRLTYRWQGFQRINGQRCAAIHSTGEGGRENGTVPLAPWPDRPTQTVELNLTRLRQTLSETAYFALQPGRLEHRQWQADFELAATAAVPTPNGPQQQVGVAVSWQIRGTLRRRNPAAPRAP
jgi:hypothetical protein